VEVALVEGHHQASVLPPDRRGLQLSNQALQPAVGDPDRPGVHLVVEIRHDEHDGGQPAGGQVRGEAVEREDPVAAGGWSRMSTACMNGSTASVYAPGCGTVEQGRGRPWE
jgi:hypothetical protein